MKDLKLISMWTHLDFQIRLYEFSKPTRQYCLSRIPFGMKTSQEICFASEDFSLLLEAMVEAMDTTAPSENHEVLSTILSSNESYITFGWRGDSELILQQGSMKELAIPSDFVDETINWLINEFELLNIGG